jgi:hypothetical protein
MRDCTQHRPILRVVDTALSKAHSAGDSYGHDGTRTRDLRRDRAHAGKNWAKVSKGGVDYDNKKALFPGPFQLAGGRI